MKRVYMPGRRRSMIVPIFALVTILIVTAVIFWPGGDNDSPSAQGSREAAQGLAEEEMLPPTWTPDPLKVDLLALDGTLRARGEPTSTALVPTATIIKGTPRPTAIRARVTPTIYRLPTRPPVTTIGRSKLGIHVVQNNDPRIMDFVRRAQPAVMKGVGDLGFLSEVKAVAPRVITIGRIDGANQMYYGEPEARAREFVGQYLEQFLLNPQVDYWEGWNEPTPNGLWIQWFARFEQERVREMAKYGLKAAVGGFSPGRPAVEEFLYFVPAVATAMEYGGILSIHEAAAPDLKYGFGETVEGFPAVGDRGAFAFRYRWYYEEFLKPIDLVIPLVLSELSVDGNSLDYPGPRGDGWRDFATSWVQRGLGPTGEEAYLNQLKWYDDGVRRDGYVIGFAIFTAGGGSRWYSYDVNDLLPDLAEYVASQN